MNTSQLVTRRNVAARGRTEKLAEYCDVFCESKVFTIDEARRILLAAREQGLGLRIHADQLSLSGGRNWPPS